VQKLRGKLDRILLIRKKMQPHQSGGPNSAAGANFAQHDSSAQVALDGGQNAVGLIVQFVGVRQQIVVLDHLLGPEAETLESILSAVILGQRLLDLHAALRRFN
jgi:hypothetical protein